MTRFLIITLLVSGCANHTPVGDYSGFNGPAMYQHQSMQLKSKMTIVDNGGRREWSVPSVRNGWAGDCSNFAAGMQHHYGATIYRGRYAGGYHAIACVTDEICSGTYKPGVFSRHIPEYSHFTEYL